MDSLSLVVRMQQYNVPEFEPAWWSAIRFQHLCEFLLSLLLHILDAGAGALVIVIMVV